MAVQWMTGVLLLMAATRAGASETAWGRAVEGVQLGLAVSADSGPLPSELSLEVQVRNVTSEPRQLAVEACPQLSWTSFTLLNVRVWCFGELLRDMPSQALAMTPVEMKNLGRQVEEVAFGFRHTCARTAARGEAKGGDVLCWGEAAADVSSLSGKALALTAGDDFTCALTVDGSAWCWGSGYEGQLGSGRLEFSPRPVRVRLQCQGKPSGGH
jgi:hypothetical protein